MCAFRAAAAVQKTFDFGAPEPTIHADEEEAQRACIETIEAWASLARCRDVRVLFTGPHNFRKKILPTYKGNRKGGKPLAYWATVRAVKERFRCDEVDGLEADDLMGILATSKGHEESIVVTLDKDLRTVPGRHFNPVKDSKPCIVTPAQANLKWFTQTLTGDTTDNYAGCPGIGPKRAETILSGWDGCSLTAGWKLVVEAYKGKKLTEADALVQARVAKILTRDDYDRDSKEVILWDLKGPQRLKLEDVVK
ncbi:hypothetical protein [Asaia sp. W19]|uniref:hypothetical protein n=1 Tax=Asaia sp. W19 TaxID=2067395 RepID=UPI001F375BEE|nr:hypothetical protein [Asaia sp. W19]